MWLHSNPRTCFVALSFQSNSRHKQLLLFHHNSNRTLKTMISLQHWIMCSFSVIFITWPFILYISTINDAGDVFSLPSGTWRFLRSTRKLIAIGLQNIFKTRVNYCINAPLFYHLWGLFQDFENKEKKAHSTFRRFSAIVLVVH